MKPDSVPLLGQIGSTHSVMHLADTCVCWGSLIAILVSGLVTID